MRRTWANLLWGQNAKLTFLLAAAAILLFTCLGSREIWTQEHRWADIVYAMFYYHDFLHPNLNGNDYYDKPLLSYWLIVGVAKLLGSLTTWAMRLPSAIAGLLAVWSIYSLGTHLKDRRLGLLAGWMLLTTFYFIFWARTSSADMLNMAGTLFAVAWYFAKKSQTSFFGYVVFFLILALTALCKGLVAPVVAAIVIFPDLIMNNEWKKHLKLKLIFAMIPAAIVYVLPFWASTYFSANNYAENGLMLVYRENILRYFQPFDHKGPIWTYFVFLPVYLLPWTVFFIPALFNIKSRWKSLTANSKWLIWAVLLLFVFFTLSGSRRNYYVLPLVPFALLLTADWVLSGAETLKRNIWAGCTAIIFFVVFFITFDIVQPLYYAGGGMSHFSATLRQETDKIKPWSEWNFVMLDPESKSRFYLGLPPKIKNYPTDDRNNQTTGDLLEAWPMLQTANTKSDTIFISRKQYEEQLKQILTHYTVVEAVPSYGDRLMKNNPNLPIAFVPKQRAKKH